MTKEEFRQLIHRVLDVTDTVSITRDSEGHLWFDLNTRMKSAIEIALVNERCVYRGRYDATGEVHSFDELVQIIDRCKYGRDYGNSDWLNLIGRRKLEQVLGVLEAAKHGNCDHTWFVEVITSIKEALEHPEPVQVIRDDIMKALTGCPHSIDRFSVTLKNDPSQGDGVALAQIVDRVAAIFARPKKESDLHDGEAKKLTVEEPR